MAITLADAQQHLKTWLAADLAVASGQSYAIGARVLTRSDAADITDKINYWSKVESQLLRIQNGKSGIGVSLARFSR